MKKNCPICKKVSIYGKDAHFPFCSARCRDRDLMGWSDEEHIIQTPLMDADSTTDLDRVDLEENDY